MDLMNLAGKTQLIVFILKLSLSENLLNEKKNDTGWITEKDQKVTYRQYTIKVFSIDNKRIQNRRKPINWVINSETCLEPSLTPAVEVFCENSEGFLAVNYFRKNAPLRMFDSVFPPQDNEILGWCPAGPLLPHGGRCLFGWDWLREVNAGGSCD